MAAAAAAAAGAGAGAGGAVVVLDTDTKGSITANMTDEQKAERDRNLLAKSRQAGYTITKDQEFPENEKAWLTDASLHRAALYLLLPECRKAAAQGTWDPKWNLKINYPIALDLLLQRRRSRFTERLLANEYVVFEAVCVDRRHFVAVVYDTRKEVRREGTMGRITLWDPFGWRVPDPDASPSAIDQIYDVCRALFGKALDIAILSEKTQSDSYQCGVWVIGLAIEYLGDVVNRETGEFSMCTKAPQAIFDLTFDVSAESRHANQYWVSSLRRYLRKLTRPDAVDPEIEQQFVTALDHTAYLFPPVAPVAAAAAAAAAATSSS